MLRFGYFTNFIKKEWAVMLDKFIYYLAFILEFDDNYYKELSK